MRGMKLFNGEMERLQSALEKRAEDQTRRTDPEQAFRKLILDIVMSKLVAKRSELEQFICENTFLSLTGDSVKERSVKAIDELITEGFILLQDESVSLSPLGRACSRSHMSPVDALKAHKDLEQGLRDGLVLVDDLHLVYFITPLSGYLAGINWPNLLRIYKHLPPVQQHIAMKLGISEEFLSVRCERDTRTPDLDARCTRFYAALLLNDLIKEMPIAACANKFSCTRGELQALQQTCAGYAGMMLKFCEELGIEAMVLLIKSLVARLTFGVQKELVDLTEIRGVKQSRARALWNAGFRTVKSIALTTDVEMIRYVNFGGPFPQR